ncbi:Choline-sulfatase [Rhodopirellula islandica]|uniref:Choline-sulfatase n=1 Tax=Rhodopirellula islandica TaxID=595434 RepID=A0A0J1BB54_RHOIS|nr:sulfatase-like hydrolase/transferase [Rhodopirellula islandica]KLU03751.1 Choline-sulfatase [Rhodopirellula islandica]
MPSTSPAPPASPLHLHHPLIPACLFLFLSVAAFGCSTDQAHAQSPRPNVVMLLADDLGYRDVGCYGGPVKTPTIDQLAAGGTRFEQFYSGCAVCSPSRATLITGRHHIRAGVYSWIHDESQNSHLRLREITLAEVLRDAGYATAHVGKWHLGLPTEDRDKPTPDQHGFDHWFATWNNALPSHRNPDNFIRNGEPVGPLEGYSCQLVADEAIGWMDRHRESGPEQPFFLNVWFHEPHAPIAAPDEVTQKYGKVNDKAAVYSGTIDNTDQAIQRLLAKLDAMGVRENTLIIYASDNGSYRADRVGNLRGQKGVNWDGGIRVPGIFQWPGHIPAGVVLDQPAGLVDVLPTICGLLNLAPPKVHLDGSDLSPLLTGHPDSFQRHQPLFWHLQRSNPIVAMRDGDYSLVGFRDYELSNNNMFVENWIPTIKTGTYHNFELYNLKDDPGQTKNLAQEQPERVEAMKQQMLQINASIMKDGMDWHLGPDKQN